MSSLSLSRPLKSPRLSDKEIIFTKEDARGVHFPHDDALVVTTVIGNHIVCQILVDNGSSMDILYLDALLQMAISIGSWYKLLSSFRVLPVTA